MAVQLGKITREHDLRTVWSNEAQAFTPWLAEHLDVLGGCVGHYKNWKSGSRRLGRSRLTYWRVTRIPAKRS